MDFLKLPCFCLLLYFDLIIFSISVSGFNGAGEVSVIYFEMRRKSCTIRNKREEIRVISVNLRRD